MVRCNDAAKARPTGENLGRVFNFKCGWAFQCHAITFITKTAQFKVENLAQTTLCYLPLAFVLPSVVFLAMVPVAVAVTVNNVMA